MDKVINNLRLFKTYNIVLFYLLIISIFFAPDFTIFSSFPTLQLGDFILPFLSVAVLFSFKEIKMNYYYLLLFIFCAIILLSMLANNRLSVLSDYFEIFKIIKFGVIILFAYQATKYISFNRLIKAVFILLLIINFIQYFEWFYVNDLLVNWYGYEKEVLGFGRNSLGFPATKRMFGLMGNPNNNAIIFLFFIVYFFSQEYTLKKGIYFYLAVFMLFLCQSKIAVIAFVVVTLIGINYFPHNLKAIITKIIIVILLIVSVLLIDGRYITDVLEQLFGFLTSESDKGKVFEHVGGMSTRGRIDAWKLLFEMIAQKPIIGYGPFKEYFYERALYSENEYILMWWRYGIFGLVTYSTMLIYPIGIAIKSRQNKYAYLVYMFCVVLLIAALTNNPLSNRNILTLYAIILGMFFSYQNKFKNEYQ
jgi:O-antigen ligase